jgi:hypothetical protein
MSFKQELKELSPEQIWEKYCGFLDISLEQYMQIQFRLLEEQIALFSKCGLGKRILKNNIPPQ